MKKIAVFLLAVLLIAAVAQAAATFHGTQSVGVTSAGWTWTYIMDLTAFQNIVVTGNNYGNHSVSYGLRNNVWTGMYIYDFTSSKFEDVIWSWSQNL